MVSPANAVPRGSLQYKDRSWPKEPPHRKVDGFGEACTCGLPIERDKAPRGTFYLPAGACRCSYVVKKR